MFLELFHRLLKYCPGFLACQRGCNTTAALLTTCSQQVLHWIELPATTGYDVEDQQHGRSALPIWPHYISVRETERKRRVRRKVKRQSLIPVCASHLKPFVRHIAPFVVACKLAPMFMTIWTCGLSRSVADWGVRSCILSGDTTRKVCRNRT